MCAAGTKTVVEKTRTASILYRLFRGNVNIIYLVRPKITCCIRTYTQHLQTRITAEHRTRELSSRVVQTHLTLKETCYQNLLKKCLYLLTILNVQMTHCLSVSSLKLQYRKRRRNCCTYATVTECGILSY
jgi:hypothetical protein